MPSKTEAAPCVVHFEAVPKAVKRALRAGGHGLEVVECRASDRAKAEGGQTTLIYQHTLDDGEHRLAMDTLSKQANTEHEHLMRDDEEDA